MNPFHSVTLHHIEMKLKSPFLTSSGATFNREFIIVELRDHDGLIGWGECSAFSSPWYTEETIQTAWHMLADFLIPTLFSSKFTHPERVITLFQPIKRNNMAKAALEQAVWDLYAKQHNQSLAETLGGTKTQIEVGVAVGLQGSEKQLMQTIEHHINEGYTRIKVKMDRGEEDAILAPIRKHFPNIPLMVDANSAYTLDDLHALQKLDAYNLLMIEQPLAADELIEHAQLQEKVNTPICLDESIASFQDAKLALTLNSCQIVNIKVARVGGLTAAKQIHDLCKEQSIPVWCGGMLDTGIGRAHNMAISSLENFSIPGDTSASSRYWEKDIIIPEVTMTNGFIEVPTSPGIGFDVDYKYLNEVTKTKKTIKKTEVR